MNNLTIKSLASSSAGNCYIVDDGQTKILIECGIAIKRIRRALDFNLSSVYGCLVSHFHADHSKAAKDIMRAGIDCYMSQGTIDGLGLTDHRVKQIEHKKQFKVGTWTIMPFNTIHDCPGSLGFLLASGDHRVLFATDTAYIPNKFNGLSHMMIECNYQKEILEDNIDRGVISIPQKNRLLFSHFELSNVLGFLEKTDRSKLKAVYLLHLSTVNSNAAEIKHAVMALTGVPVYVAKER